MSQSITTNFSENVQAYIQFIEDGNLKNARRRLAVMKNLGKYENQVGAKFISFTMSQMQDFHSKYVVRLNTSEGTFYLSTLNDFLVWLLDRGSITPVQFTEHPLYSIVPKSSFDKKIMSNTTSHELAKQVSLSFAFNSMLFSPADLKAYCETFFSANTSRMERAIYCLVWNGVPMQFIKTIRRDMVDENAKSVSYCNSDGEIITTSIADDYSMSSILDVSHSDGCQKVGKGGRLYFVPYQDEFSEYLIRPLQCGRSEIEDPENRLRGIFMHISSKIRKVQSTLLPNHPYKNRSVNLQSTYNCGRYYRFWLEFNGSAEEEKEALDRFWGYGMQSYLIWKSAMQLNQF